jgi:hypothetical protein
MERAPGTQAVAKFIGTLFYCTILEMQIVISDKVIEFLISPDPSNYPLTEMSSRNLPGCKGRLARKAEKHTVITASASACTQMN